MKITQTYVTVHALAEYKGKYLILQRATHRSNPGMWNCVSGYLQDRESAEQAALRELKEETNLEGEITKVTEPFWGDFDDTRWVVIASLVHLSNTNDIKIDENESQAMKWILPDDPIVKESLYLRETMKQLGVIVGERSNKELVKDFIEEVWNKNNPDFVEKYIADEFVVHLLGGMKEGKGKDFVINNVKEAHTKFTNLHIALEDIVADTDKVTSRLLLTATVDGKEVTSREFMVHRIAGGKFIEAWSLGSQWS